MSSALILSQGVAIWPHIFKLVLLKLSFYQGAFDWENQDSDPKPRSSHTNRPKNRKIAKSSFNFSVMIAAKFKTI